VNYSHIHVKFIFKCLAFNETCLQNVRLTCVSARVARMPHLFTQFIILDFQKCNLPLAISVWYMTFIVPYINTVQIHKFRFLLNWSITKASMHHHAKCCQSCWM